jgi:uncharacterized protein YndB with AHSA1/START domain
MSDEAAEYATEIDIEAPVEAVFEHLVDPRAMVRWMGQHATLDPTPGGMFAVDLDGVPVRGEYRAVEPPTRVVVSWGVAGNAELPPGATEVEFLLAATQAGTRLRVIHRRLPPSQVDIHRTGWTHFLDRLVVAVTGPASRDRAG